jgi:hypothetical protein
LGYCLDRDVDINNDGYADIALGAPFYNDETGVGYIIYGNSY